MWLLPEWAPNFHPLIVHFPIALLFLAGLVDIAGLLFRDKPFFSTATVSLYMLGAIAALAAFLTGRAAADSVFLTADANALLTIHADMGSYTFYFFGVYSLIRLGIMFTPLKDKFAFRGFLTVVGLAGITLMTLTATRGAELVFNYGAGVAAVDNSVSNIDVAIDESGQISSDPVVSEDGGWTWKPVRASSWTSSVEFLENRSALTTSAMVDGGDRGDVLGLTTDGSAMSFVYPHDLQDLQIDAAINVDAFDGVVMFIHNVLDASNFRFTSVGNGVMRQGRSENGDIFLYDEKPFEPDGWVTIRVVNDGTHTRAYSGEDLIAHGHGDTPDPGPVGIRLNGSGTVKLDFMSVQKLN